MKMGLWFHIGELAKRWPYGTPVIVAHDLFEGDVVGWYRTREGKPGLVLQHEGNLIVHVYRETNVHDCREDGP